MIDFIVNAWLSYWGWVGAHYLTGSVISAIITFLVIAGVRAHDIVNEREWVYDGYAARRHGKKFAKINDESSLALILVVPVCVLGWPSFPFFLLFLVWPLTVGLMALPMRAKKKAAERAASMTPEAMEKRAQKVLHEIESRMGQIKNSPADSIEYEQLKAARNSLRSVK